MTSGLTKPQKRVFWMYQVPGSSDMCLIPVWLPTHRHMALEAELTRVCVCVHTPREQGFSRKSRKCPVPVTLSMEAGSRRPGACLALTHVTAREPVL